uniref:ATP synthase subunit epsilon, mitochondrial n=1 Tax=Rhabditophanes sp. KR3021 TaxID=114890 RepID=A0AC35TRN8_9BILA
MTQTDQNKFSLPAQNFIMNWRSAGLTYVNYSRIAAKTLRSCTKTVAGARVAQPQASSTLKMYKWANGKIVKA